MMAMYPELYAAGGEEPTERKDPEEEEEEGQEEIERLREEIVAKQA
jgi:hypothetical protein